MSNSASVPSLFHNENEETLGTFFKRNREAIDDACLRTGAVLFKGFAPRGIADFQSSVECYSNRLMEHSERLTKRSHISGKINTTTEYDPSLKILLHTENSFAYRWPTKMFFYCVKKAEARGETPLSDVRAVYQMLRKETCEKFERLGVRYVRNFWEGFGPSWQTVYGVESETELEAYAKKHGMKLEWPEPGRPRITQNWPAVLPHPQTGDKIWFNHATTSNLQSVAPAMRSMIVDGFKQEDYPNNTYYGNGDPIEPDIFAEINAAYDAVEYKNSWEEGEVLLVDNMRIAHGREPFSGERKVVVDMIDPLSRDEL